MRDQSGLGPFKIAVLGDAGVGKTSLISRIKTGTSSNEYVPTIDYESGDVNWLTVRSAPVILPRCPSVSR